MNRDCDICKYDYGKITPAIVDGPTQRGPWAYMCKTCLNAHGFPTSTLNTTLKNVR